MIGAREKSHVRLQTGMCACAPRAHSLFTYNITLDHSLPDDIFRYSNECTQSEPVFFFILITLHISDGLTNVAYVSRDRILSYLLENTNCTTSTYWNRIEYFIPIAMTIVCMQLEKKCRVRLFFPIQPLWKLFSHCEKYWGRENRTFHLVTSTFTEFSSLRK